MRIEDEQFIVSFIFLLSFLYLYLYPFRKKFSSFLEKLIFKDKRQRKLKCGEEPILIKSDLTSDVVTICHTFSYNDFDWITPRVDMKVYEDEVKAAQIRGILNKIPIECFEFYEEGLAGSNNGIFVIKLRVLKPRK